MGAGGGSAGGGDGSGGIKSSAGGSGDSDGGGVYSAGGGVVGKNVKLGSGQKKKADWHVTGENSITVGLLYAVCVAFSWVLRSSIEAVCALCKGHGAPAPAPSDDAV